MDRVVQRKSGNVVYLITLEIFFKTVLLYIQDCTKKWLWSDNSEVVYTDFIHTQPDCTGNFEHCVQFTFAIQNGQPAIGWNDLDCGDKIPAICKLTV